MIYDDKQFQAKIIEIKNIAELQVLIFQTIKNLPSENYNKRFMKEIKTKQSIWRSITFCVNWKKKS